jgi:hypothetical protein
MLDGCYAEFEIPYLLEVKDSIEKNPDWRFTTEVEGYQAELRFKKQNISQEDSRNSEKVVLDLRGKICTTVVQVWFSSSFINTLRNTKDDHDIQIEGMQFCGNQPNSLEKYLLLYSMSHINKFIDRYRVLFERYWIHQLSFEDIIQIDIVAGDSHYQEFFFAGDIEPIDSTDNLKKRLEQALSRQKSTPLFQRIKLDVHDNLRRQEYDRATMNSTRLFEVWGKAAYIALEDIRNDNEEEGRQIAKNTNLISLIENNFDKFLEYDVENADEWLKWKNGAYELRKKTIHGGYRVTESEAESAFDQSSLLLVTLAEGVKDDLGDLPLYPHIEYTDTKN